MHYKIRWKYTLGCLVSIIILSACNQSHADNLGNTHINTSDSLTVTPVLSPEPTKELTPTVSPTPKPVKKSVGQQLAENVKGEAWELGNLSGNLSGGGIVCQDGTKLYYKDKNHDGYLCRSNLDFSEKEVLDEVEASGIQVWGEWIYYSVTGADMVRRIHKETKQVEVVFEGPVSTFRVTKEGIFYLCRTGTFHKLSFDGKEDIEICDISDKDTPYFQYLELYGDCAIIGGALDKKLNNKCRKSYIVKLDGSGYELLNDNIWQPRVIGDKLWYYRDGPKEYGTKIVSFSDGKEQMTELYTTSSMEYNGVIYYGELYSFGYIDDQYQSVRFYPEIYEMGGAHNIYYIYLAADKIFFCDYFIGEIPDEYKDVPKYQQPMILYYYDLKTGEIQMVP